MTGRAVAGHRCHLTMEAGLLTVIAEPGGARAWRPALAAGWPTAEELRSRGAARRVGADARQGTEALLDWAAQRLV